MQELHADMWANEQMDGHIFFNLVLGNSLLRKYYSSSYSSSYSLSMPVKSVNLSAYVSVSKFVHLRQSVS